MLVQELNDQGEQPRIGASFPRDIERRDMFSSGIFGDWILESAHLDFTIK